MKKTLEERKEYAKIIAQAWVDEDFKAGLLADPATVLAENGIEITKDNEFNIKGEFGYRAAVSASPPYGILYSGGGIGRFH